MDIKEKEESADNIPVVYESRDVSPKELLGLPLRERLILKLN